MSAFRDKIPRLDGLATQVLGISTDASPSQKAWARHLGIASYPFLSDFWPHGEMAKQYGLLRLDGFPERAIVIFDKQGIIRYFKIHELETVPSIDELIKEVGKLPR